METIRSVICKQCREKVDISNVRYDKKGEDLICMSCYNRQIVISKKQKKGNAKEKLMCLNCNYRFTLHKHSRATRRCPYCGGVNLDADNLSANDLLKQVGGQNFYNL